VIAFFARNKNCQKYVFFFSILQITGAEFRMHIGEVDWNGQHSMQECGTLLLCRYLRLSSGLLRNGASHHVVDVHLSALLFACLILLLLQNDVRAQEGCNAKDGGIVAQLQKRTLAGKASASNVMRQDMTSKRAGRMCMAPGCLLRYMYIYIDR
jgi:hypothetical protein